MPEEELTEDQKTLETFLKPAEAKEEDKTEAAAEEKEEEGEQAEEQSKEKEAKAAKGSSFVAALRARVGSLPDPGSVAFPLLAVLVMLLFIVPVGGKTRAVHLWNVLIGKEALPDEYLSGTTSAGDKASGFGSIVSGIFKSTPAPAGTGSGAYQDNVVPFAPRANVLAFIEEGSS